MVAGKFLIVGKELRTVFLELGKSMPFLKLAVGDLDRLIELLSKRCAEVSTRATVDDLLMEHVQASISERSFDGMVRVLNRMTRVVTLWTGSTPVLLHAREPLLKPRVPCVSCWRWRSKGLLDHDLGGGGSPVFSVLGHPLSLLKAVAHI